MTDEERVALALAALAEITGPDSVGPLVDAGAPSPGVIDLRFAAELPGYSGWFWTVSTSDLDGVEPTVLELELLPGDGALVAPPWVPWEERLAEWRRTHVDEGPEDDDLDDEELDDDELDDEDALDEDDEVLDDVDLHGADVDAVEDDDERERTP